METIAETWCQIKSTTQKKRAISVVEFQLPEINIGEDEVEGEVFNAKESIFDIIS